MDVEVVKSDLFEVAVEAGSKDNSSVLPKEENGVVHQVNGTGGPIKFGSHGVDEPKESGLETNFPRDAVDDWPAPQQIHSFYFVKYRPYEDPKLKEQLEKAETNLRNKSAARSQIFDKLRAKKSNLAELIAQVRPLREERRQMWDIMEEKNKEMKPLREALGKLQNTNGGSKEKGVPLLSSEEELNKYIKSLEYRIQHETIEMKEEKRILREIKQVESTRDKVAAYAAARMKIEDSMGGKDALQDQVKLMGVDVEGVMEDRRAVKDKIKPLEEDCAALKKAIDALKEDLDRETVLWQAASAVREGLWKEKEKGNASYFQNRTVLNKAKELAAKKDIEAIKKLDTLEMEKFMSLWNGKKDHREDYEKRLLSSLDFRQLSRDGRIRNPDEKPLVPVKQEALAFSSTAKTNVKQAKESPVSSPALQVVDKAIPTKENKKKETGSTTTSVPVGVEEEIISGSDKLQKSSQPKKKEVDEAKLKEMKREEELAKAKQALERKKKLAEKAAAKAAIKAQKEAEKKLKEREKKAKKKAAASSGSPSEPEERPADEEVEATEDAEKVEEDVKSPVPSKGKPRKENTPRFRTKPRGPEALPRVILKRKRSTNYWVWVVPAAAVAAGLFVLAVGYTYFI